MAERSLSFFSPWVNRNCSIWFPWFSKYSKIPSAWNYSRKKQKQVGCHDDSLSLDEHSYGREYYHYCQHIKKIKGWKKPQTSDCVCIKYLWILQIDALQRPTVQPEDVEGTCWQARAVGNGEGAKMGTRLRHNLKVAVKKQKEEKDCRKKTKTIWSMC